MFVFRRILFEIDVNVHVNFFRGSAEIQAAPKLLISTKIVCGSLDA